MKKLIAIITISLLAASIFVASADPIKISATVKRVKEWNSKNGKYYNLDIGFDITEIEDVFAAMSEAQAKMKEAGLETKYQIGQSPRMIATTDEMCYHIYSYYARYKKNKTVEYHFFEFQTRTKHVINTHYITAKRTTKKNT